MKTSYIVAGVGVVAVVGVVAWLTVGTTPVVPEEQVQTYTDESAGVTPESDSSVLTGQDTFANLFKLGRTLECSFSFKDNGISYDGTGFFAGKQMRTDSMYMGDGRATYMSSMISDGTTMYTWSKTEAGNFAMKMAVPPETTGGAESSAVTAQQQNGQVTLDQKVQYTCKPWNVDGSVFVPPADVQFMDMNDMMKGMPGGMQIPDMQ